MASQPVRLAGGSPDGAPAGPKAGRGAPKLPAHRLVLREPRDAAGAVLADSPKRSEQRNDRTKPRDIIKRAPWLVEERGYVKPPSTATPTESLRKKLRERAALLGLPLVDYVNTLTMAIRYMGGGRTQFLAFLALAVSESDDAAKFLTCFAELTPAEQDHANIDLVCQAAGASPVRLLQAAVGAAFTTGIETANLMAATAFPQTLQTTIDMAHRPGEEGFKDREMLMKHHGFLPQPKGTTINVSAVSSASAAAAAKAEPSMPSFLGAADAARAARTDVQRALITEGPIDVDPLASVRAGVAADADLAPVVRTASVVGDADAVETIDGNTR